MRTLGPDGQRTLNKARQSHTHIALEQADARSPLARQSGQAVSSRSSERPLYQDEVENDQCGHSTLSHTHVHLNTHVYTHKAMLSDSQIDR